MDCALKSNQRGNDSESSDSDWDTLKVSNLPCGSAMTVLEAGGWPAEKGFVSVGVNEKDEKANIPSNPVKPGFYPKNPWALHGRGRTLHSRGPGPNQTLCWFGSGFLGLHVLADFAGLLFLSFSHFRTTPPRSVPATRARQASALSTSRSSSLPSPVLEIDSASHWPLITLTFDKAPTTKGEEPPEPTFKRKLVAACEVRPSPTGQHPKPPACPVGPTC